MSSITFDYTSEIDNFLIIRVEKAVAVVVVVVPRCRGSTRGCARDYETHVGSPQSACVKCRETRALCGVHTCVSLSLFRAHPPILLGFGLTSTPYASPPPTTPLVCWSLRAQTSSLKNIRINTKVITGGRRTGRALARRGVEGSIIMSLFSVLDAVVLLMRTNTHKIQQLVVVVVVGYLMRRALSSMEGGRFPSIENMVIFPQICTSHAHACPVCKHDDGRESRQQQHQRCVHIVPAPTSVPRVCARAHARIYIYFPNQG